MDFSLLSFLSGGLFNKLMVIVIDVIALVLGFWVYFSALQKKLNKTFIWMAIFMIFWVSFAYFARELGGTNNLLSLLFIKIAWFVTPLFFTFLYLLVINLIKKEDYYRLLTRFAIFFGIIASLAISFTDLVVKDIEFRGILLRIIYGNGMLPFLAIIFFRRSNFVSHRKRIFIS